MHVECMCDMNCASMSNASEFGATMWFKVGREGGYTMMQGHNVVQGGEGGRIHNDATEGFMEAEGRGSVPLG
eukprot:360176-Chlamydomonas_euryale.AAC.2